MAHSVRMGPIEAPKPEQLIYIDDREGGCTGYCYRFDLPQVLSAMSIIYQSPPTTVTEPVALFMQHAPRAIRK